MKTQSKYSTADLYKIQKIKRDIQDLRKKISEIDCQIAGVKQDDAKIDPNKLKKSSQKLFNHNDDSKTESVEEEKEKPWGKYILAILLAFYLVVMIFL